MAASSKVVCACILIVLVISSHADARRLVAATCNGTEGGACKGGIFVQGYAGLSARQKMAATATSTEQVVGGGGEGMPATTTDSRPTAPGNSPGIGNKAKINN
uniref:Uncharacterized protein n=1 Tax=Zea mays TaxID=4577 RepID=B6U3Q3_MAIZE|nr:hypothetical protein [Zea mays]